MRDTPRALERCTPDIQEALKKAMANIGVPIVVAKDLPIAMAENLQRRLNAMVKGLTVYQPRGSHLQLAGENRLLHVRKVWDKTKPLVRDVTLLYEGRLLRPSEQFARNLEEFNAGRRSTPF